MVANFQPGIIIVIVGQAGQQAWRRISTYASKHLAGEIMAVSCHSEHESVHDDVTCRGFQIEHRIPSLTGTSTVMFWHFRAQLSSVMARKATSLPAVDENKYLIVAQAIS